MRIAAAFITVNVPRMEQTTKTQAVAIPRGSVGPDRFAGLAAGVKQASNTISQIATREVAEQDASRLSKAQADYEDAKVKFLYGSKDEQGETPGLLHTLGEAAVNPADGKTLDAKAEEWHRNYLDNQLGTLGNDRQKALFTQYADRDRASVTSAVVNHEWKQGQIVKIGNANAATDLATTNAIKLGTTAGADPELYANALTKVEEATQVQAMIEGFSPESQYAKDLLSSKMSKLHSNIIISKVSSDDDKGAIAYYEEHGDTITDPAEALAIGKTISTLKIRVEGKETAAAIWEKHKPTDVNVSVDIAAMREEVAAGKGGEAEKAVALARVEEIAAEHQQANRLKEESASNKIFGIGRKEGATYDATIKAINLEPNIDNRTRESLQNWAESKFKINEGKSGIDADKKYAQKLEQLGKLLSFQNEYLSGGYGTLTPEQLGTKVGDLGEFTDNAMQFVDRVNTDLNTAKVVDSDLKDLLHTLGQSDAYKDLVPNIDKPKPEDKAKLAVLQGEVQRIMVTSQQASGPGKGMSLKAATLKAIQNVRTDKGWAKVFDNGQPFYLVGTDLADKYSKGNDPSKWSKETQANYIKARWEMLPSNQGKTLAPAELEVLRNALLQTEQ
jgi:hypothetical protein